MVCYALETVVPIIAGGNLTHCGLVAPYGDINLCQQWLRWWLVAWRHQAIIWTNVDLSWVRSSGIHMSAILQEIPQPSVTEISRKITYLKFYSNIPGANEFIGSGETLLSDDCQRTNQTTLKHICKWASYQIRTIAGCACAGNTGNVFSATDFKENR